MLAPAAMWPRFLCRGMGGDSESAIWPRPSRKLWSPRSSQDTRQDGASVASAVQPAAVALIVASSSLVCLFACSPLIHFEGRSLVGALQVDAEGGHAQDGSVDARAAARRAPLCAYHHAAGRSGRGQTMCATIHLRSTLRPTASSQPRCERGFAQVGESVCAPHLESVPTCVRPPSSATTHDRLCVKKSSRLEPACPPTRQPSRRVKPAASRRSQAFAVAKGLATRPGTPSLAAQSAGARGWLVGSIWGCACSCEAGTSAPVDMSRAMCRKPAACAGSTGSERMIVHRGSVSDVDKKSKQRQGAV